MITLHSISNISKPFKRRKRVGRGPGSKRGKTCCRGHKGDKSRSGYKRRHGDEGGQLPLYRKVPCRGFSNARFAKDVLAMNLDRIELSFEDGETLSIETLIEKGFLPKNTKAKLKILGRGELNKKVVIKAHHFSKSAVEKLEKQSIEFSKI